jgi:hypothetical protein
MSEPKHDSEGAQRGVWIAATRVAVAIETDTPDVGERVPQPTARWLISNLLASGQHRAQ